MPSGYPNWGLGSKQLGCAPVHRIRAERSLGHPLPPGAQVHHVGGSKSADALLVICPSAAYHKLLHLREKILAAGGNPDTDKVCSRCNRPVPLTNFDRGDVLGASSYCKPCRRAWGRERYARRQAEKQV